MDKNRHSRYYTYIKPILKNQAIKSFAPYIFSLFTITFFVIFVIHPTVSIILALNKSIEESKQVLTNLQTKSENLDLGKRNLEALNPGLRAKIDAFIPSNPTITAIVKSLQNTQQESSTPATIIQIQPLILIDSTHTVANTLSEVSFNYSTQGPYIELITFLNAVNKMPRLISIDGLSIGRQIGEESTSLSASGRAYYLK